MINSSKSAWMYKLQSINKKQKVYSKLLARSKARISNLPRYAVLPDCFRAIDFAAQQLKLRCLSFIFFYLHSLINAIAYIEAAHVLFLYIETPAPESIWNDNIVIAC